MNYIDIFNGDADGIIALLQLRLAEPKDSQLVTGVKRDIQLMNKLEFSAECEVTVLDISMEKNIDGLTKALNAGAKVSYFDHHRPGTIPEHASLNATIDMDPNVCTALLVDKHLNGQFHLWAITAAYGDNLLAKAEQLADEAKLNLSQRAQLKEFGTLINYNGYGATLDDLHIKPVELFQSLLAYDNPFSAIAADNSPFAVLQNAYKADMALAEASDCAASTDVAEVYLLPNQQWSRRVGGVFGNQLANNNPNKAHAVVSDNGDDTYLISVRAPLNNKTGADEVCSEFVTGGGRKAAAGINRLPHDQLDAFIRRLNGFYA
ncbi:DHH family phosphoesterase [Agarivorans sp. TSD2052]|uniref:DHH family phosphoesterase n=1 Tax=Agarivorans sp. TSD2052 TaxID=2937286 RepID=UPI00200CF8AC|nr:DHH family phosphoesterase [Agarivorans sp. TSD2052]UPW20084.1 DHH family phosphoesterase [Agarivorans sp. TSD2052]